MARSSIERCLICLIVLVGVRAAFAGEPDAVPDFRDTNQWRLVRVEPLLFGGSFGFYEIGRVKAYRHVSDALVGFEEYLAGDERPFWKRWGPENSPARYNALRRKGSETWVVGPPGSTWFSLPVFAEARLQGVWFMLVVPATEEAYGRYFPVFATSWQPDIDGGGDPPEGERARGGLAWSDAG
jgi:hypothetical protein